MVYVFFSPESSDRAPDESSSSASNAALSSSSIVYALESVAESESVAVATVSFFEAELFFSTSSATASSAFLASAHSPRHSSPDASSAESRSAMIFCAAVAADTAASFACLMSRNSA